MLASWSSFYTASAFRTYADLSGSMRITSRPHWALRVRALLTVIVKYHVISRAKKALTALSCVVTFLRAGFAREYHVITLLNSGQATSAGGLSVSALIRIDSVVRTGLMRINLHSYGKCGHAFTRMLKSLRRARAKTVCSSV